jgi:hypothetical protein
MQKRLPGVRKQKLLARSEEGACTMSTFAA